MANKITLTNQAPYYDDFDPAKDYVQVLYRPGYPVQARELTTLQSFLQEQIARVGDVFFKNGTPIKNAEITLNTEAFELVLTADNNSEYPSEGAEGDASLAIISSFENKTIRNADGTVKAIVLPSPISIDKTKFVGNVYIQYLTAKQFDSDGGYIYADNTDNPQITTPIWSTYSQTSPACVASSTAGIFFASGKMIQAAAQSVVVSNTTHLPDARIGFYLTEEIVTQDDDPTLYDNARGTTNEGAPGAHRLKYSIELASRSLTDVISTNFFAVATFIGGVRQITGKGSNFDFLEILARRTYDESGHYAIKPFTHDIDVGDSDGNFLFTVGPSKAYVKGWELERKAPTYIYDDRGLSNTKLTKSFVLPVAGVTAVTVTGVTGTLPGSTTGSVFDPAQRLLLTNGAQTIGVARGWAVKDEYKRGTATTKLYLYDVKMFNIIEFTDASYAATLTTGNDLYSLKTRASVFTDEGSAGVANAVAVINSTGKFRPGQTVGSHVLGTESTIASVTTYQLSDVTNISSTGASFTAVVTANTVENETSSLILDPGVHIKTLKDGSTNIIDNDYNVIEDTGAGASVLNAANGHYDEVRVDDQTEITKTLKFAYLKIGNPTSRIGVNYGWTAADREISLHYPDVHKVYKINETTANSFATGRFTRLTIATSGVIPQGSTVVGDTSGTEAIVALQNSSTDAAVLSNNSGYHQTSLGTAHSGTIEVIFTKGQAFTENETLTVTVPSGETEYTYQVTYTAVTAATGTDITGNYLLDSGQRKEYYDIGRLVRKDNVPAPAQEIVVFFSYFDANPSTAHYYSADSYSNENFFKVDARYYGATKEIKPKLTDDGVDLRNVIDFRLRVQPVTAVASSPFNFIARKFYDQDRVVPSTKLTFDFYQYLGRIDLISYEKTDDIVVLQGIPSVQPQKPETSVDGMDLFWLNIPPAVRYPEDEIYVEVVDNRRYTMRDIGGLERRINRLEETVSLTVLESQALHDDIDGRTKSGFAVDDFSLAKNNPNSPSDPAHPEYNASVDTINKQLIPSQTSGVPVDMNESSFVKGSTFFSNYYLNAFTEEAFSTQMEATTSQLINPFATWTFTGDINLTPDEDNWRIRRDEYFTELYGELKPFEGSAADFQQFSRITTASPGGVSATINEWVGRPRVTTQTHGFFNTGRQEGHSVTTNTFQTQRQTTTVSFDEPRVVAGTTPTTTINNSVVLPNPQDYYMRALTVSFTAENLRPQTEHTASFGNKEVLTGLTSNDNGTITSSFTIPAQTFKAGEQPFELKDTGTRGRLSSGTAIFTSRGHLDTFRTIAQTADKSVTVRTSEELRSSSTAQVVTNIRQAQPVEQFSTADQGDGGGGDDPIAQMFTLPKGENGIESSIITSLDLWFSVVDTRLSMNTVFVEIRETKNGYPGGHKDILGRSFIETMTVADQVTSITDTNCKNFKFREPVVLRGGTEYAIVIKSPSDIMACYVAQIGEQTIDGKGIHSDQPNVGGYYGSFFTSQNASTWNAEQNKDLTYRLKRAKFDTSNNAVLTLVNTIKDTDYYKGDIGAYNQGLAMEIFQGSKYVRVHHPNHGFHYNNAQTTISGVTQNTNNGISDSELNGTHTVLYPTLHSYMIKADSAATDTGRINTGIWTNFATQDTMYDSLITNFMITKEESDEVDLQIKSTITSPINLVISTGDKIANSAIITPYSDSLTTYEHDRLVEFEEPRIIRSKTNASGNDLTMTLTFTSGTAYTSPILKKGTNLNPIVFRNLTGYLLNDSEIESLTVRASDSDDEIDQKYVSYLQGVQSELEHSAYVTKQIDLEIPADGFTVFFDAVMKPGTSIIGAYKVRQIGDDTPFDELEWQDFPYAQQVTEENYGEFATSGTKKSIEMRTQTPFEFTSFKFRFRMKTENEALIPKISELRIISDI